MRPVLALDVRTSGRDTRLQPLAAALLHRCGLSVIDENAPDNIRKRQEEAADQGWSRRDLSLLDFCREALRATDRAVPASRDEQIRAAVGTGALGSIFTAAVSAQLLASYQEAPDTTQGWVREADVRDFKSNERPRLEKTGGLEKLPRGGTATHATLSDIKEEYKIARYAKQFVVDDQDIVDDRLDALLTIPAEIGQAARRLRPDLVYSILLANANLSDGVALFEASSHANLGTTGTALAASTLEAAIAAMGKQTENGVPLNVKAAFLIVPQDLRFTAATLLHSAARVVSADSGGTLNPLLDENIDLRSENRIGVSGVIDPDSGNSYAGTAINWFLAANPAQAPTIEVGYLQGTGRQPQIREFTLDRGQYGLGWDVKMDIGAKALDYRGLYKATGAA